MASFAPLCRRSLRMVAVVAALAVTGSAQADEYGDVNQLLRQRKPSEALARADQFLAGKPRDPQMRFLRGVILTEQGNAAEAVSVFTRLTEDYPELPEPYNNLAALYAGQGQFDKARGALEMAIRINPSYATAHENLGDVYAKLASQAYGRALQLDAGNTTVRPKLALINELFAPGAGGMRPAPAASSPAAPASTPAPAAATKPVTAAPAAPAKAAARVSSAGAVPAAAATQARAWW